MDEAVKKALEKTEEDIRRLSEKMDQRNESLQHAIEEVSLKTFEGLRGVQDDLLQRQNALHEEFTQMMRQMKNFTRQMGIPETTHEDNMHIEGENLTAYPHNIRNITKQSLAIETPATHNALWVQGQSSASHFGMPGLPDFNNPAIVSQPHGLSEESRAKQMEEIRETLKAIKSHAKFHEVDVSQMMLVPGLVLPPKFKMPEFEKFNGTQDPIVHLRKFTRKMANYVQDDKMMIHCFQESLEGGAAEWYAGLTTQETETWNDAANLFAAHYKHNADMDPTRDTLRAMERKRHESFKEYARRWREVACRVKPPLAPEEYSTIFIKTLEDPYYDRLWGLSGDDFSVILRKGELLEIAIKEGRIESATQKRKERETHAVILDQSRTIDTYPAYSRGIPSHLRVRETSKRLKPTFTPIPITYTEAFAQLRDQGILAPTYASPVKGPPFPEWYNPNTKCEYHNGLVGHDTENCLGLKHRIEGLLRKGKIDFN